MANSQYLKVVTPIRTIKSDIGQVKITLFNDQIALNFQPATGKNEYGNIKYNGAPQFAPNVRFSVGVASAISSLIKNQIVPACDNPNPQNGHWDVFACKRKNYEAYLAFDANNGQITMTGTENNNGNQKHASYTFPQTVIKAGQTQCNINGEALAFAELLSELGGSNEMPAHMRQYNQAVKDNFPNAGQSNNNFNQQQQNAQPAGQFMNTWRPN